MKEDFPRAVTKKIHPPKPDTVRLWSIQPLYVWERLCREKSLYVDPNHEDFDRDWIEAYDWMREQMARRLPEYHGHYPWWAYDYKLDLRVQAPQYGPYGTRYVRMELAVPKDRVLLSAYWAWHFVLNVWYLPQSDGDDYERESNAWDAELERNGYTDYVALPEPWATRKIESWNRIFDVEALRADNTIQANFERLNLEDVVRVTEFTARKRDWGQESV